MRKLTAGIGMALFVGTVGTSGVARADYGMAGCGLGSLLFGQDNSMMMQVLAATTNGTGIQTFGITSGTSNCVSGGTVKAAKEQAAFAEVNFQDLKRNMAAGGGEYLTSFSTLLGCDDGAKAGLAKMTQEKYAVIIASSKTTPIQMLSAVKSQIKASSTLSGSCSDERAIARAEGRPMTIAKK